MFKKILALLLVLTMMLCIVACKDEVQDNSADESSKTESSEIASASSSDDGESSDETSSETGNGNSESSDGISSDTSDDLDNTSSDTSDGDSSDTSEDASSDIGNDNSEEPNPPVETKSELFTTGYSACTRANAGIIWVKGDSEKWQLYTLKGKKLTEVNYTSIYGPSADGHVVFDNHYVYDKNGNCVYQNANEKILSVHNGVMRISNDNTNYVYKLLNGTVIWSGGVYGGAGDFNDEGYAVISSTEFDEEGPPFCHSIVIDKTGKVVYEQEGSTPVPHTQRLGTSGWFAGYGTITDDVWIENHKTGKNVSVHSFYGSEMYNIVYNSHKLMYGYDKNGCYVSMVDNLYIAKNNDSYHLIDFENGKVLASYNYIGAVEGSKYCLVELDDGRWGYINKQGTLVKSYDDASDFFEGIATVKENGKIYVINENFVKISDAIEGDAAGALGKNTFRINRDGKYYIYVYNK